MRARELLLFLVCVILVPSGCSANQEESQHIASEQSIWQLTDAKGEICGYLADDDPDVRALIQLIQKHVDCVDNRSAADILFEEESTTYTNPFLQYLKQSEYPESLKAMYEENNLSVASVIVYWNPSTFSEDELSCKVDVDSVFQFTAGTDSFLDSLGVSLNQNYVEHRIYYCTKEEGEWKISNIEKSALSIQ